MAGLGFTPTVALSWQCIQALRVDGIADLPVLQLRQNRLVWERVIPSIPFLPGTKAISQAGGIAAIAAGAFRPKVMDLTMLKLTEELCRAAIRIDGRAFKFVPDKHKTTEFCLDAVKNNGAAFKYVPEHIKAQVEAAL